MSAPYSATICLAVGKTKTKSAGGHLPSQGFAAGAAFPGPFIVRPPPVPPRSLTLPPPSMTATWPAKARAPRRADRVERQLLGRRERRPNRVDERVRGRVGKPAPSGSGPEVHVSGGRVRESGRQEPLEGSLAAVVSAVGWFFARQGRDQKWKRRPRYRREG